MDKNRSVRISKNLSKPEDSGKHFRVVCMTGKNQGLVYYLEGERVIMGRGNDVDIQILDTKSSREHAEMKKVSGDYFLTDLDSQNGIIINDLKVIQHKLVDGDEIVIGKTVYKYNCFSISNKLELDEFGKVVVADDLGNPVGGEAEGEGRKVKKTFYYALLLAVVVVWFLGDENKEGHRDSRIVGPTKDGKDVYTELLIKKKMIEDKELRFKLDDRLRRGLREYREKNYFRAIEEFNLALILSPNDGQASAYLDRAKQRLDGEIKGSFNKARQEVDALKYAASLVSYCSVIRLLKNYPDDERYTNAENEIGIIEERMGKEKGEVKCF